MEYYSPIKREVLIYAAAAAAKLLQSFPTLCNPRDGSPPGFSRQEHWSAISFSTA